MRFFLLALGRFVSYPFLVYAKMRVASSPDSATWTAYQGVFEYFIRKDYQAAEDCCRRALALDRQCTIALKLSRNLRLRSPGRSR
jgi:hypothetical protein